jgi:hypothetical protein
MRPASGPVLFSRYAYPPNRLGLCGPDDARSLRDAGVAADDREVRELARGFEGAFPYLQLIAGQGGVPDPLDPRVVESYWLGGGLAARVGPRPLHRSVDDRFRKRMKKADWAWLDMAVRGGSHPIHAFHVLEIYPRAGLMRGGEAAGAVLDTMDSCRIRWATVLSVDGDRLVVRAPRLEMRDGLLRIGAPQVETVTGWVDGGGALGGVVPGDRVSLHWGWACDRLTDGQLRRLTAWTRTALDVANRAI